MIIEKEDRAQSRNFFTLQDNNTKLSKIIMDISLKYFIITSNVIYNF